MSDSMCLLCFSWLENNTSCRAVGFQNGAIGFTYKGSLIMERKWHSRSQLQSRFPTTKRAIDFNLREAPNVSRRGGGPTQASRSVGTDSAVGEARPKHLVSRPKH